jgi:hypothetical protein
LAFLSLEVLDLVRRHLPHRVASKPLLAGLQELLRSEVIEVLIDPFLAAEFSDAVLATKADCLQSTLAVIGVARFG